MFSFYEEINNELDTEREIIEVSVKEQHKKRRYFDFDRNYEECA